MTPSNSRRPERAAVARSQPTRPPVYQPPLHPTGEQLSSARREKRRLIREAEALARSTDWVTAGRRLNVLYTRLQLAGTAGPEDDERLWRRFKRAGDHFARRRAAHAASNRAERSLMRLDPRTLSGPLPALSVQRRRPTGNATDPEALTEQGRSVAFPRALPATLSATHDEHRTAATHNTTNPSRRSK